MWGETGTFLTNFSAILNNGLFFSSDSEPLRAHYWSAKSTDGVSPDILARMQNLSPEENVIRAAVAGSLRTLGSKLYDHPNFAYVGFKAIDVKGDQAELCAKAWPDANIFLLVREPGAAFELLPREWRERSGITPVTFTYDWTESALDFLALTKQGAPYHLLDFDDLLSGGCSLHSLLNCAGLTFDQVQPALQLRLNRTPPDQRARPEDVSQVSRLCSPAYKELRAIIKARHG